MPKRVKPLNAKQLEKWRPDPVRTLELVDGAVEGLRVRLAPNGSMSWSLNVRVHGARRRIALGRGLKLAEARKAAMEARSAIGRGQDPAEAQRGRLARQRAAAIGVGTLGSVIAAYYETGPGMALRSKVEARALIERIFVSHLSRSALDIRPAELQLVVDGWRSKSSALHAVASFRPLVRWATERGLMAKGDILEAPTQGAVTQRVLTHEETASFLRGLGSSPHDCAARFMLLTGARRDEVCGAKWDEFRDDVWTIPSARRKDTRPNGRRVKEDHVVSLSRQAQTLLKQLERDDGLGLVFVGEREARLTNWPRWSMRMEKRLGFDVTPHALRRTCATLAGDLGQPPHVVSALLGHRGVAFRLQPITLSRRGRTGAANGRGHVGRA